MAQVEFIYNGKICLVQCQENKKMAEICNTFISKSNLSENDIYFFYDGHDGSQFDKNLTFIQMANSFDKSRKKMSIIVYDKDNLDNNNAKVRSKNIICLKCNELIKMKINNYRVNLFECKNLHNINNISLKDLKKSQIIDLTNIKCNKCNDKNKSNTYNNEFYKCYECNINLCPLCKTQHNNTHHIINYDNINFLCSKHNEPFTDYCTKCKMNICFQCDEEHNDHDIISLRKMMINKSDIIIKLEELKKSIRVFEENIAKIIEIIKNVKENIYNFYKLEENIINNYGKNQRNYELLYNINEFIKYNNTIIKGINNINNEDNIDIKFKTILNLYNQINSNINNNKTFINDINKINNNINNNKNEIKLILKIKEKDINKKIYFLDNTNGEVYISAYKEENHNHDFLKELNEANVELYINNKKSKYQKYFIPEKEGIYEILLKFKINLKDCSFMFYDCKNIVQIDMSAFNTKNANDMRSMFGHCSNLISLDLSSFNTENVTNMSCMFSYCTKLENINISSFNTKNVKDMDALFWSCQNLKDINLLSFNTENVEDICWMFNSCYELKKIDISNFNVKKVFRSSSMFESSKELKEIKLNKNTYELIKSQIDPEKIKIVLV